MAKYYRQQGETKRHKTLRFVRPVLLLTGIAILIGTGLFLYDIFHQKDATETSSSVTRPTNSTITSDVQIQTTPYFQIQTPLKWRAIANETRDGHYVYRQFNGQLIEQELIIDVNDPSQPVLASSSISRVLPVSLDASGRITVISTNLEHCKKVAGTQKNPFMATMDRVTFPCTPDATNYRVMVGLIGGSNVMLLSRPDGTKKPYKITYQNVSANPNSRDLVAIVKTFETR